MTTTLLPSIDKEPNQKQISKALKATVDIWQIEEDSNHPGSTKGEAQTTGTKLTETTNTATSANKKDSDRKKAGRDSRRTNPVATPKDKPIGPEFT
jgi:hypothetical protein